MTISRRILISGTSRGLGRAIAEHHLAGGDRVVGCARGGATIEHPEYSHVVADVTSESDVQRVLAHVRERLGTLDAVINNAGTARMLPLALTPLATARNVMDVNFIGTFQLTHGAIRLLRKSP